MKRYIFTFVILILSIFSIDAKDVSVNSLLLSVRNLPDSTRLQSLDKWASEHVIQNTNKIYIDALLSEAQKQHSSKYIGKACFLYAELFYNSNYDSMRYYIHKGEPFLLKSRMYEEAFRMRSWNVYALVSEGNNSVILKEVQDIKNLARQVKYQEGEELANHALANFYIKTGMTNEGIRLYNESLKRMTKQSSSLKRRIYILRQLLDKDQDQARHFKYLRLWDSYIGECESKGIYQIDETYSVDVMRIVYYDYLSIAAFDKKNANSMFHYLTLSDDLIKKSNLVNEINGVNNLWVKYYLLTKNPNKGLALCEQLLVAFQKLHKSIDYAGILDMKSQFLMMQGNKKEALKCYQRFIVIRDSLRTTSFYRSLKSLDTQRQSDQLQLKNKQLQLETSQYHYRMMTMKYDFAILIVVCIIMVIVIFFARRISIESKKAQLKAEEADRMKSAFLANINHEIRTPLNAIVGFSQLIVDEKDPEVRKQYSEIILDNNERLQRLIGDVLDLSKIESNSVKLSFSNVELLPLLEGIYHSNLSNMPVDVELQMQPCDDFTLYTDGSRLAQIITCLLNYAIQHTHKGYIRIGYQTTANQVQFFVEDTGDGIAEDKISTIFEHSTQLNRWNNTDLSLAISKGLTLLLGGEISLKSTLGKGSTFYVTLFTNFVTLPTNKKEKNHHE